MQRIFFFFFFFFFFFSLPINDAKDGVVGDLPFLKLLDPDEKFRLRLPPLFDTLRQFPVLEEQSLLVQLLLKGWHKWER